MCGIGWERRSSRPSHDTLGIGRFHKWPGVFLFSLLWVASVPSWCLWCRENRFAINFVTPAQGSLCAGEVEHSSHSSSSWRQPWGRRLKDHSNRENAEVLEAFRLVGSSCGYCEGSVGLFRRLVLMLTLFLSVSQWVNNTTELNRDANTGERTCENLLHERHLIPSCVDGVLGVKTAVLGQFSPHRVLIVRTVAP